jgi:flagellin
LTANSNQLDTLANAGSALDSVLEASNQLTQNRASLGSTLSELETASSQIATNRASTSATLSQIRDANVADAITSFTREQILTQTSVFALQQANSQRANVLNLLS